MAAVLACALLFGWCVCRLWAHDVFRIHAASADACLRTARYEFIDRQRSQRVTQRLRTYVRQLEQARCSGKCVCVLHHRFLSADVSMGRLHVRR
jgi:hypothetical protein